MKVRRHRPKETGDGRQIGGIDVSAGNSGHCCSIDSPLSPSPHPPDLTSHWSSAICHPPFAIRYLPFAIRYLPFAIRHPPSAIRHPPFAICHSPFRIPHSAFSGASPQENQNHGQISNIFVSARQLVRNHGQAGAVAAGENGRLPPRPGAPTGERLRKFPKPSQVGAPRSSKSKEWKSCRAQHEASEGRQERDSHEHAWGLVGWCLGHWGCIARASLDGGSAGAGVHR